ncbi:type I-B CRISPR-associated protein Cas7/Cst2/DevR [Ilyobacter sp.]|uniref:type I-B CRISPR-associated protein Cas7/Cst2/DevR n=1 Tax=Ilyobacter sp. TaxID=3100343 RepID=UPI003564E457
MSKRALTLTVVAHMTSNYGESLGNIGSVQKLHRDGKTYSMRTRESIKQAVMEQSGMYKDLKVKVDGATQKEVNENLTVANCKALEGGYMNTASKADGGFTRVRNSSFYMTDAIAVEPMTNDYRFHNNLFLASKYAKDNDLNVQKDAGKVGLMPYQYEYDKGMKVYSITIDLEKIGKDVNFDTEASSEEKFKRVEMLLDGVENLSLIVRGNLDNAEPLFIVGGLSNRMTHYFENVVRIRENKLQITDDFKERINSGYKVGMLNGENFDNETEIKEKLMPISVIKFFNELKAEVKEYYGV